MSDVKITKSVTIQRVKLMGDDRVQVSWTENFKVGNQLYSNTYPKVTFERQPQPELVAAIQKFSLLADGFCEMDPKEYTAIHTDTDVDKVRTEQVYAHFRCSGIRIVGKDGRRGCAPFYHLRLNTSNKPLNLNPPEKFEAPSDKEPTDKHLSKDAILALEEVLRCTEDYLAGAAAQVELDLVEAETEDALA